MNSSKLSNSLRFFLPIILSTMIFSISFLDPINWPKNIALLTITPILLARAIAQLDASSVRAIRVPLILISTAIVGNLISAIFTEGNFVRTLWGVFGRNNGFLTTLALYLLCLASMFFAVKTNRPKDTLLIFSLGFLPASIYGTLQKFGLDPVKWSKTNEAFSFFGNTNFASAILAISTVCSLLLLLLFGGELSKSLKLIVVASLLIGIFATYATQSLQGLMGIGLGLVLCGLVKFIKISKIIGYIYATLILVTGLIIVSGFLGFGPLGDRIEQYTLSLRLKYWTTGLLMGLDNLPFGVGFDNYGDYFQNFRPDEAIVITGVNLTTNNAHNPIVQSFATTGITGSLPLALLLLFASGLALKSVMSRSEELTSKAIPIIFIVSWSMSLISIDNIAIAVLNWTILGTLVGSLYAKSDELSQVQAQANSTLKRSRYAKESKWVRISGSVKAVGILFSILTFVFSWSTSFPNRELAVVLQNPPKDQAELNKRIESLRQIGRSNLTREVELKWTADGFLAYGLKEEALKTLELAVKRFPRDMSLLDNLAFQYESAGMQEAALKIREKQLIVEKNNWRVYYFIGLDNIAIGNYSNIREITTRIDSLRKFMNSSEVSEWQEIKNNWQQLND